jgi:hypothetical protein
VTEVSLMMQRSLVRVRPRSLPCWPLYDNVAVQEEADDEQIMVEVEMEVEVEVEMELELAVVVVVVVVVAVVVVVP